MRLHKLTFVDLGGNAFGRWSSAYASPQTYLMTENGSEILTTSFLGCATSVGQLSNTMTHQRMTMAPKCIVPTKM